MLNLPANNNLERYTRQTMLPGMGIEGQQKLFQAKVLVVGAGGLGCPVLQYLAAAGVGTIGIADDDVVSLSNLHRQILYGTADIGRSKAIIAARQLALSNPDVNINQIDERITNLNAWQLFSDYDIIIDGSDNFSTRYLVNDACVLLGKPLVYGSVYRFEGQVGVFNVNGSANYRDVFPQPPAEGEVPDCNDAGVLGVLPGVIGTLMATEAIKLITGIGSVLVNSLLTYHSLYNTFYTIEIEPGTAKTQLPRTREELEMTNYALTCFSKIEVATIDYQRFDQLLSAQAATFVDVRETGELPAIRLSACTPAAEPVTNQLGTHKKFGGCSTVLPKR